MTNPKAKSDFRHKTPGDILGLLAKDQALAGRWADLTPLARNEWICWLLRSNKKKPESNTSKE